MKTRILLASVVGFSGLALLAASPQVERTVLRDAPAESEPLNGDVQGLIQDIKTRTAHQKEAVSGQAIGSGAPQCLRLEAFRIKEEYRFLYRGTMTPPEKIFLTGFLSGAEKDRGKLERAEEADLEALQEHLSGQRASSPYISTSQKAKIAALFASDFAPGPGENGWLYLIDTNRGVSVLKQVERSKIKFFYAGEREVIVPGRIPREEIVGAWPEGAYGALKNAEHWEEIGGPASRQFYFLNPLATYGSFIKNPNYSGPLKLSGDICPPPNN